MNKADVDDADVQAMLSGDRTSAIEAAKRIIERENVAPALLAGIAEDRTCPNWSRVAAIYALGVIDDKSASAPILVGILADRDDDEECRTHAAEALAHMGDSRAASVMEKILMTADSTEVKRWCVYALSELGGPKTREILWKFAKTNPTGALAEELRSALG